MAFRQTLAAHVAKCYQRQKARAGRDACIAFLTCHRQGVFWFAILCIIPLGIHFAARLYLAAAWLCRRVCDSRFRWFGKMCCILFCISPELSLIAAFWRNGRGCEFLRKQPSFSEIFPIPPREERYCADASFWVLRCWVFSLAGYWSARGAKWASFQNSVLFVDGGLAELVITALPHLSRIPFCLFSEPFFSRHVDNLRDTNSIIVP